MTRPLSQNISSYTDIWGENMATTKRNTNPYNIMITSTGIMHFEVVEA